jgi:hypothetical protein
MMLNVHLLYVLSSYKGPNDDAICASTVPISSYKG